MTDSSSHNGLIHRTLGNPMRFMSLVNGCLFLMTGVILSIFIYTYDYPSEPSDPHLCERAFFPMPPVMFAVGFLQLGYYIVSLCTSAKETVSEDPNRLQRSIPFVICSFLCGVGISIVFGFGIAFDSCGERTVLSIVTFCFVMPTGIGFCISSLFYLYQAPRLACCSTRVARYWIGLVPIALLTMWWWPFIFCTKPEAETTQQVQLEVPIVSNGYVNRSSSFAESMTEAPNGGYDHHDGYNGSAPQV